MLQKPLQFILQLPVTADLPAATQASLYHRTLARSCHPDKTETMNP
jgi:hypothetical protein